MSLDCRIILQVLGFLIEVMEGKFENYLEEVLEATIKILRTAASESEEEDDIPDWQGTYASLIMTQKLLQQFPQYCLQAKFQVILWLNLTIILQKF